MALSVVARLHGVNMARQSAGFMEYVWHEDAGNDPFA